MYIGKQNMYIYHVQENEIMHDITNESEFLVLNIKYRFSFSRNIYE